MAIKITKIDDLTAVDESGTLYDIKSDVRGMNEKMWLCKRNGEHKDSFMIKFSTRKPGTLSDLNLYNEVICSKICEQLELDHVKYEFCEFQDLDGTTKNGVVSQNYKEDPNWVEINGRGVHESYGLILYDNNFGVVPKVEKNTVYAYIEQLKVRFESRKMTMSPETESKLTDELLTLSLFDFCTCQIDRHWGNVGWIHNNTFDDAKFKIKLVPIYDNECSFLLDEATEESLRKLLTNINTPKRVQMAIDTVNSKRYNSPYLGIRTSLVREKEDRKGFLVPKSYDERNISNAKIFASEIAHEICTRPKIKQVYDKFANFDMNQFLAELDIIPEELDSLKEVYSFVWNTRMNLLQQAMENYKNSQKGDTQNESGLSSF